MRTMEFSREARDKLTEPWEECVLYVYDDKVPKSRNAQGKLEYPEWDGGPVRGTLTIFFGHTDAAGAPKIVQGMRGTRAQADEVLSNDLEPCVRHVNELLKVEVTQHVFDGLVDTYFNCPSAAVAAIKLINAGNAKAVPAKLMQYTYSKGEHMEGLDHRRAAEIAWMKTPDDMETPAAPHPDVVFSPKAERNPQPKPTLSSKVVNAGGAIVAGGGGSVIATIQAANDAAAPIKEAKQNLADLGILDQLSALAHSPTLMVAVSICITALGGFVIFDRWQKLRQDHV
jgi:lysozyme